MCDSSITNLRRISAEPLSHREVQDVARKPRAPCGAACAPDGSAGKDLGVNDVRETLLDAASGRAKALCSYSGYEVGAGCSSRWARLRGCNVENASYGLSLCAERSAVAHWSLPASQGCRAVVVTVARTGTPAGSAQTLSELRRSVDRPAERRRAPRVFKVFVSFPSPFEPIWSSADAPLWTAV